MTCTLCDPRYDFCPSCGRQGKMTAECRHCGRQIINTGTGKAYDWIDPEATGDDEVWRETCDEHDTFMAEHEPEVTA